MFKKRGKKAALIISRNKRMHFAFVHMLHMFKLVHLLHFVYAGVNFLMLLEWIGWMVWMQERVGWSHKGSVSLDWQILAC